MDTFTSISVDITGLARHHAGECDACGYPAVELLIVRESDEITDTGCIVLRYCRVCVDSHGDDAWTAPGAEILLGDPVDASGNQLGMFEIPRASTFDGPRAPRITGQLTF